jgi:hypothetical protein
MPDLRHRTYSENCAQKHSTNYYLCIIIIIINAGVSIVISITFLKKVGVICSSTNFSQN